MSLCSQNPDACDNDKNVIASTLNSTSIISASNSSQINLLNSRSNHLVTNEESVNIFNSTKTKSCNTNSESGPKLKNDLKFFLLQCVFNLPWQNG